jgi:hypothetical protein
MNEGTLFRRWVVVLASLSAGCGGGGGGGGGPAPAARPVDPDEASLFTNPYPTPAGCYLEPGEPPEALQPDPRRQHLPVLLKSEADFQVRYRCSDQTGKEVTRESGVDFSRSYIAVFTATAKGSTPDLLGVIPAGNKLIGVFGVTSYCGGTPPPPMRAAAAVRVPAQDVTLDSRTFYYPDKTPCSPNVP